LATELPEDRIETLLAGNPMEAKLEMAGALTARYHGADEGARQREEFVRVFSRREAPSEMADVTVPPPGDDGLWWIVDLIKLCGFAQSTSEARRCAEGGGVRVADEIVPDWRGRLPLRGGEVLRVGRRKQARLVLPA